MNKDHLALIQFVLENAEQAPIKKRVTLYRALAELCGDAAETKELKALADKLDQADKQCREFAFQFSKQLI